MLQKWRHTQAKTALGHLRSFALVHMLVQEVPHEQGTRDERRVQRDHRLDEARQHLLEYAKIAEKVSWAILLQTARMFRYQDDFTGHKCCVIRQGM